MFIADVSGNNVPFHQRDGGRQVHFVSGKTPLVGFAASPLHRFFRQAPQRIKTFEFKAAVIAEQPVQTGELQHNWRIMVTALDSGTLATGTPHETQTFRRLARIWFRKLREVG